MNPADSPNISRHHLPSVDAAHLYLTLSRQNLTKSDQI